MWLLNMRCRIPNQSAGFIKAEFQHRFSHVRLPFSGNSCQMRTQIESIKFTQHCLITSLVVLVISPYRNYCCWLLLLIDISSEYTSEYIWEQYIWEQWVYMIWLLWCWSVGGESLAERSQELRNCISRRHFSLSWAGALQFTRLSVNTIFVNQAL